MDDDQADKARRLLTDEFHIPAEDHPTLHDYIMVRWHHHVLNGAVPNKSQVRVGILWPEGGSAILNPLGSLEIHFGSQPQSSLNGTVFKVRTRFSGLDDPEIPLWLALVNRIIRSLQWVRSGTNWICQPERDDNNMSTPNPWSLWAYPDGMWSIRTDHPYYQGRETIPRDKQLTTNSHDARAAVQGFYLEWRLNPPPREPVPEDDTWMQ